MNYQCNAAHDQWNPKEITYTTTSRHSAESLHDFSVARKKKLIILVDQTDQTGWTYYIEFYLVGGSVQLYLFNGFWFTVFNSNLGI